MTDSKQDVAGQAVSVMYSLVSRDGAVQDSSLCFPTVQGLCGSDDCLCSWG